jgi:hypothetical protein
MIAATVLTIGLGFGALAACGTSSSSPTATLPGASASNGSSPAATEANPAGDIPDQQAFVAFTVPSSTVSVKVPEGWSKSTSGGATTFTDKLNSVTVAVTAPSSAPTEQSVTSTDVPTLKGAHQNFTLGKVSTVQRPAGPAILVTYQVDSAPDPVTNKVVRDAVERYTFFKNGHRVDLTLTGPQGSDNVDPWRIVTDSVTL